jgi:hypothetical protein
MQDGEKLRLEQIQEFLEASQHWEFEGRERREIYEWVMSLLRQHRYGQQGRAAKGLLRRYLIKMTGMFGVNYFFGLTTTISPYQRQLLF